MTWDKFIDPRGVIISLKFKQEEMQHTAVMQLQRIAFLICPQTETWAQGQL